MYIKFKINCYNKFTNNGAGVRDIEFKTERERERASKKLEMNNVHSNISYSTKKKKFRKMNSLNNQMKSFIFFLLIKPVPFF